MKNLYSHNQLKRLLLFSVALFLFWQSSAYAFDLKEFCADQGKKYSYIGSVVIPKPTHSIKKMSNKTIFLPFFALSSLARKRFLKRVSPKSQTYKHFKKYIPELFSNDSVQIFQKSPQIAARFGIDLRASIAYILGYHDGGLYDRDLYDFITFKTFPKRFDKLIDTINQLYRTGTKKPALYFSPTYGNMKLLFLRFKDGEDSPIGLLLNQRLYLVTNPSFYDDPGAYKISTLMNFYKHMIKQKVDPLTSTIQNAATYDIKKLTGSYDLLASTQKGALKIKWLNGKKEFVKGFGALVKLDKGLDFQMRFGFKGPVKSLFKMMSPTGSSADWLSETPSNVGWYAKTHVNPAVFKSGNQSFKDLDLVKLPLYRKAMLGFLVAAQQTKASGIDLPALLKSFSGQFASGVLWDAEMSSKLSDVLKNRGREAFLGNLKGIFMQLGFHNDSGAKNFVKATLLLYKAMKQQFPKVATMFTISKVDGKQNSQVKIQLKNSQAFYLLARKKHVLFAGHKETRDRFLKVWKGKAPSFGAKQPQLKKAFIEKDNRVLLRTRMLLDFINAYVPSKVQQLAMQTAQYAQYIMTKSKVAGTQWQQSLIIPIDKKRHTLTPKKAPKLSQIFMGAQMNRVAGGMIAFPALYGLSIGVTGGLIFASVAKYIRKSKTQEAFRGLKDLKNRIITRYDSSAYNKEKSFICAGKGWICSPTPKPCHNGNPMYRANPKHWKRSCWSKIKFSMKKDHYYQYCYKAEGKGSTARVQIEARGDLDCDGKLSTYRVYLKMNGRGIETSNTRVKNGLE